MNIEEIRKDFPVICHNDANPTNIMADDIDPEHGIPRNPSRPVVFIRTIFILIFE